MKQRHRLLVGVLVAVALAALVLIAPWQRDSLALNGTVHYVDADADGANNGDSWTDAYTDLQLALDEAGEEDQIWVAEGTYKPTSGTDRTISFQMKNGVAIYGGFDPSVGHTEWEDRDWANNVTILSGDLDGNDGPNFENNDENSYHVFYHPEEYTDLDSSAVLDGFVITAGNANGWPHYIGGGMANVESSPTLTNCTFEGNSAVGGGGGMYNGNSSSPVLTNCTFSGNWGGGEHGGGMRNNEYSSPTLTNCTFSGNSTYGGSGGGMANSSFSAPTLTNCTFTGNSTGNKGGGMFNLESSPTLTNCTFSDNSAWYGGGVANHDSSPTLTNCILWADTARADPEIHNLYSTPDVTYSDVQGGYTGEGNIDVAPFFVDRDNSDFHLHPCSPCVDAGDNYAPALPPYDFEGDDRKIDGDEDGEAIVDMGVDEVAVIGTCFRIYLPLVLKGY